MIHTLIPAPLNRRRCVWTNDGAANKCDIDIDIDIETKPICFNMGKRRHPLFGSGRDFFVQISSPTYAANRTESIGANRMLIGLPWVKPHSKPNPYASTWENDVI